VAVHSRAASKRAANGDVALVASPTNVVSAAQVVGASRAVTLSPLRSGSRRS
jgi:hypothetical protein